MTSNESSNELFEFEVKQYLFLTELGFRRENRLNQVTFASNHLAFVISLQRWGEPAFTQLRDLTTGTDLPSPLTALQYFLDDFHDQWGSTKVKFDRLSSLRASIATAAELCRQNSWVFTSTDWTRDPGFMNAIKETESWYLSMTRIPSAMEVLKKLRSFHPRSGVNRGV